MVTSLTQASTAERRIYRSDVHPALNQDWIDAANQLIDRARPRPAEIARLKAALRHARFPAFAEKLDEAVSAQFENGSLVGPLEGTDGWLRHTRRATMRVMAGFRLWIPTVNPSQIRRRRKKLAAKVKRLARELRTDCDARDVSVVSALEWLLPAEPREGVPVKRMVQDLDGRQRVPVLNEGVRFGAYSLKLDQLLDAVAQRIESGHRLYLSDALGQRPEWLPGAGVADAELLTLVRALYHHALHILHEQAISLIAQAATIATGKDVSIDRARRALR